MESNLAYQRRELISFNSQDSAYFDNLRDFNENLDNSDPLTDLEWIETGTYGAGACFALQVAERSITPRTNGNARIGAVLLQALYGKPFRYWQKLRPETQKRIDDAVTAWRSAEHDYAQKIEDKL